MISSGFWGVVMPKFRVCSREVVYYVNEVEAINSKEAEHIVLNLGVELNAVDGDDFIVNSVEEIKDGS